MVSLVAGCGPRTMNVEELVGTYVVKYRHGSEKLILKSDGTFTQDYMRLENGQSTTNSGKWEFWKEDRAILLRDAIEFDKWGEQGKQPSERIVWRIRIAKRFGKISLIIGEEGVLEYDKAR